MKPLSINDLKDAFEKFDWPKARAVIDAAGDYPNKFDDIGKALQRAGRLVLRYPSPKEADRDVLLAQLQAYFVEQSEDGTVPVGIQTSITTLRTAERGFRSIVDVLTQTAASRLGGVRHVAAAMARASKEAEILNQKSEEQYRGKTAFTPTSLVKGDDGVVFDLDGAYQQIVEALSLTIQMEASNNRWVQRDKTIELPCLPETTEEEQTMAGSTFYLASSWRRWITVTERARMGGKVLRALSPEEFPPDCPEQIKNIFVEQGEIGSELLHFVATERVASRTTQNYVEVLTAREQILAKSHGRESFGLPPADLISVEELHALWTLEQYLAFSVVEDTATLNGLRLVEWVRGYACLQKLSGNHQPADLNLSREDWLAYFGRFGLSRGAAEKFLTALTFRLDSRDLCDQPFVAIQGGRLQLFATALRASNLAIVLLSTLSNLDVQIQRKGKAFENKVLGAFADAGLAAYAFKVKRDGQEYEYDAVVPWGDYLFVFECKNRSLPMGNAVQEHYFDLQTAENLQQVRRLINGLTQYPDILEAKLPPGANALTVVPVLLNCFPYAVAGDADGIHLYDYSALSRFFESGTLRTVAYSRATGLQKLPVGQKIWEGEKPSPEDLLAQLRTPHQFKRIFDDIELRDAGFQLSLTTWVFDQHLVRKAVLPDAAPSIRATPQASADANPTGPA